MRNIKIFVVLALTVIAISCKKDEAEKSILPIANFNILNDTIPYGIGSSLVFQFTNTSTNATSYSWNFGGGYTSTEVSPSYSYTTADVSSFFTTQEVAEGRLYTNQVRLLARNGADSSFITKTIAILEEF